jgi:hypothetical protein
MLAVLNLLGIRARVMVVDIGGGVSSTATIIWKIHYKFFKKFKFLNYVNLNHSQHQTA